MQAAYPGHIWAYDFVEDALADGTPLRILTVMDEFTREGLDCALPDRRRQAVRLPRAVRPPPATASGPASAATSAGGEQQGDRGCQAAQHAWSGGAGTERSALRPADALKRAASRP